MLQEIADLGFSHAELSHGVGLGLVPGVLNAVQDEVVKISSTHNFCPLPPGLNRAAPNAFVPSSKDKTEIQQWLRYTQRTFDFAKQVGAPKVVLHLGLVEVKWFSPVGRVERRAELFKRNLPKSDPVFCRIRNAGMEKLRKNMGPFWDQVLDSLTQVAPYAAERGICLGCENREGFDELPFDGDFRELFYHFVNVPNIGYWHDAGHAQLKERMGLLRHGAHLEAHSDRLIGFHLHDVVMGRDHQVPGTGEVDFHMIREHVRPEHTLVLELSPRLTRDEVLQSRDFIVKLFDL